MMVEEAPDYIEKYSLLPFTMKVQDINRTLADKVFAVCDYYLQNKTAKYSRHLYDIYKLLPLVPQDNSFKKLVKEVRQVLENIYKSDYVSLTEDLLEEKLNYETVIPALKQISENGMFAN